MRISFLLSGKIQFADRERTAEQVKMEIGHALIEHVPEAMEIRGRDLVTGLPKTIMLQSNEIQDAMRESLLHILEAIRATLEDCPPELSGDIVDRGVILTGGGALNGIKEWLTEEIVVPVHVAQNPLESVAIGTGRSLEVIDKLQRRLNSLFLQNLTSSKFLASFSSLPSYCGKWRNVKEETDAKRFRKKSSDHDHFKRNHSWRHEHFFGQYAPFACRRHCKTESSIILKTQDMLFWVFTLASFLSFIGLYLI